MSRPRAVFTADSPTNPATPTAVRRVGLGASLGDITGTADGAAAWKEITSQLTAEGGPANVVQDNILQAQSTFENAFNGLAGLGVQGAQVIDSAKLYTLQATSVLGAVKTIAGLISAGDQMPPLDVVNGYMGAMMGLAGAAGLASAGIGAAVIGAVAFAFSALQAAGFLPNNPPTANLPGCPGLIGFIPCGTPPSGHGLIINNCGGVFTHNCVAAVYPSEDAANVSSPNNPNWRHFPTDPQWFAIVQNGQTGSAQWQGGQWWSDGGPRMIDAMFPQFRHLECEQNFRAPGAVGEFQAAYFTAWKLNAELAFNGTKPLGDAQVLAHTLAIWNRSHEVGVPYTFPTRGNATQYMSSPGIGGDAVRNCADVQNYGSYISYLTQDYANHPESGQPNTVTINTGVRKNPPQIASLSLPSTTTSTTRKLAAGLVWGSVIALGGTVAYSLATKTPVTVVWQRAFDDVAKFVRKPLKAIKL